MVTMSPATNPPPAPAAPAKPAAAGTAHATAPAKAPAAPAAAQPAAGATAVAPATQDKKSGGKMADMFKKVGSSVGGKTKGMPKKVQMIFAVVILLVVVIVIGAVAMRGGSTAPKKPSTINVEDLQDWSVDIPPQTQNLAETESVTFNVADLLGGGTNGTYFIKEVTVTLTWRDEDDVRRLGRMRTNQPDEFEFVINTTINATAEGPATMNDVNSKAGSIGPITMKVSDSGYDYVIVGNSTSLRLPETVTTSDVTVTVHLINAGDFHASGPEALYWNDLGNDFTVKITVSGKMYTPEAKAPAKK